MSEHLGTLCIKELKQFGATAPRSISNSVKRCLLVSNNMISVISFCCVIYVITYKILLEEKLSQAGQKTNKVLVKNLFTQTHLTDLNIKKL